MRVWWRRLRARTSRFFHCLWRLHRAVDFQNPGMPVGDTILACWNCGKVFYLSGIDLTKVVPGKMYNCSYKKKGPGHNG